MSPKISIIIPTHNRVSVLGETIDSIIGQSYINWECIIVDDNSSDYTKELVEFYAKKDNRIQFCKRPTNLLKGANSCRNYGFKISTGEYIIWFDSDDIMSPKKIEINLNSLIGTNYNFSIDRFNNYDGKNEWEEESFNDNLIYVINGVNYTRCLIFWGTINVIIKKALIEKLDLQFNEKLKSGQEYNFFVKLFNSGEVYPIYLNEILCYRRIHNSSIQSHQKLNKTSFLLNKYYLYYETYSQIKNDYNKEVNHYLLKNCQSFGFRLSMEKLRIPCFFTLLIYILEELGMRRAFLFSLSVILGYGVGRGYKYLRFSYPNSEFTI